MHYFGTFAYKVNSSDTLGLFSSLSSYYEINIVTHNSALHVGMASEKNWRLQSMYILAIIYGDNSPEIECSGPMNIYSCFSSVTLANKTANTA